MHRAQMIYCCVALRALMLGEEGVSGGELEVGDFFCHVALGGEDELDGGDAALSGVEVGDGAEGDAADEGVEWAFFPADGAEGDGGFGGEEGAFPAGGAHDV